MAKETYYADKRDLQHTSIPERARHLARLCRTDLADMSKETYLYGKRGLFALAHLSAHDTWHASVAHDLSDIAVYAKETFVIWGVQAYASVSKETCLYGKKDLIVWQKRPRPRTSRHLPLSASVCGALQHA